MGDAKTFAEAARAVRVVLDEDFHLFKMLKEEEVGLMDWLRLFRGDCLYVHRDTIGYQFLQDTLMILGGFRLELERFLSMHSTTDMYVFPSPLLFAPPPPCSATDVADPALYD